MRKKVTDLALHGGNPVRVEPFPPWPQPTDAMRKNLLRTLDSEKWGVGSEVVQQFEREFARFHHSRFAISTNSGTAALWVALKAAGVKLGDEIIIPAYTFVATASAVLMANAVPVFVDIDGETLNMDPHSAAQAITERTRVILPVHVGGNPAHVEQIGEIAREAGIVMIEDAAQAHGSEWKGRRIGSFGIGGIFSFQTSKNMTAGEGGVIVSDDEDFVNACFSYHNVSRPRGNGGNRQRHLGGNFRLSAIPASLLLAQFDSMEGKMKIRDANAEILETEIDAIPGLTPQKRYPEATRVSRHIYIFMYDGRKFNDATREEFIKALNAEGIPVYPGYGPVYSEGLFVVDETEYPWLEGRNFNSLSLPVTERISRREAVWLRQNCLLGDEEDTLDIVKAIKKVATYYQSLDN
ncbi:MAG: DegT/DnrJ/EryC1/StrS family aminotransferase [Candidatus Neomarinimicrobiota bacterium]